jgi:UDP-glucose 4-epimerase
LRILIVGGGFLGCAIANHLQPDGHSVRVLSPNRRADLGEGVKFISGRLELGIDLDDHLRDTHLVVDAASSMIPASVQESPAAALASGVAASSWLAERAAAHRVSRLVFVSSGGTVYGESPSGAAHAETDPLAPSSAYGAFKAACEMGIRGATAGSHTSPLMLRVANAYGPGQNLSRPQGVVGVGFANMLRGTATMLYGAEQVVRDFVHIRDVAAVVALVAGSGTTGVLNVGSGQGVTLSHLVELMGGVVGQPLPVEHRPRRPFDVVHSVLDIRLARTLGWAPAVELRDGLAETWRWIAGGKA